MKVLIAGTGRLADEFETYLDEDVIINGYIETKPSMKERNGKKVYSYEEIHLVDYDLIIVANMYSDEIKKTMIYYEIDLERVVFIRPWSDFEYLDGCKLFNWDKLEKIAPKYKHEKLTENRKYMIMNRMRKDLATSTILDTYETQKRDYVRYRTFELLAEQIKGYDGNLAEVGVFQGEFAQIINAVFPERKLYLFDTFESFAKEEYEKEKEKGNCVEGFDKIFYYTSENRVLNRMPHAENCIIKKGLFPDSAKDIEDKFVFVSIDVDFEESIYQSLKWFYPRMVKGGVIFVHDYNSNELFGVKEAISRYEKEEGCLNKMPIADWAGTLSIIK